MHEIKIVFRVFIFSCFRGKLFEALCLMDIYEWKISDTFPV